MKRVIWILLLAVAGLWAIISLARFLSHLNQGKMLRLHGHRYERLTPPSPMKILIAGDSVAFGLGASDAYHSIAGLFGRDFPAAAIRNVGVSGAETDGLVQQLQSVHGQQFTLVVMIIGANDVVHLADLKKSSGQLDTALGLARQLSQQVVFMPEGNMGNPPLFPQLVSFIFTPRSRQFRASAIQLAQRHGAIFVDVFHERSADPWRARPSYFYAADYFHPADPGYADWYRAIRQGMDQARQAQ